MFATEINSFCFIVGILQGVYWGLGTGGGTIVGGYLSHVFGFKSTFRAFAVATGVVLAVFLATQLISKYSNLSQEDGDESSYSQEDDKKLLNPLKSNNSSVHPAENNISEEHRHNSQCEESDGEDNITNEMSSMHENSLLFKESELNDN